MNWLLQVIELMFCWVPRPYYVNPDEQGVRITLGKRVKEISSGYYCYWPLIHQFIKICVATQGVKFAIQSVTTKDDVDIAIRGAITYKISNAAKAIFETSDFDETLEAIGCGVIESFVAGKTYEELRDREALKEEIKKGLRKEAEGWGIRLMRVYIPDIGRVRNIRVMSDTIETVVPVE